MESIIDDIIPPSSIKQMKMLGDNMDMFQSAMKQILNFQNLLYEGLNNLASKYVTMKNEVNFLNNQLLNVDDAVQAYLSRNPVTVYTRDGVELNDALDQITDRSTNSLNRINKMDEEIQKLNYNFEQTVQKDDISEITRQLKANTQTTHESALAIEKIQEDLNTQRGALDEKWNVIKDMFRQQIESVNNTLDSKVSQEDLDKHYIKHTQIQELVQLFTSIPREKATRIPDIIPQVFSDTKLTMEEKIQRCYELLTTERKRVIIETEQINDEFAQLKKLAEHYSKAEEEEDKNEKEAYDDLEVRDIGCDSGFAEIGDIRYSRINRGGKHRTIGTSFNGPEFASAEAEAMISEFTQQIDEMQIAGNSSGGNVNTGEIVKRVVNEVQGLVENQITFVLDTLGKNMDKKDIVTLIQQLRVLQELKTDMDTVKIKLGMKMDVAVAMQELDNCVKRDEFYQFIDSGTSRGFRPLRADSSTSRPRTAKAVVTPRKKTEIKGPLPLVPARNSKMLGVNEKYAIGDDGKMYLRELSSTSRPESAQKGGSRVSYYDRSKMIMEADGVETVLDFQPFVPTSSAQTAKKDVFEIDLNQGD